MQPYYTGSKAKIKGIALLFYRDNRIYQEGLYSWVGINVKDSNGNYTEVTRQKFTMSLLNGSKKEPCRIVEILFDSVIETLDTFYVFTDFVKAPNPPDSVDYGCCLYDSSSYIDYCFSLIGATEADLYTYKIDPNCVNPLSILFKYNLHYSKGKSTEYVIKDSICRTPRCKFKKTDEDYVTRGASLELYGTTPAIFPIMWNGPTYDTVIKGGQTIEGDFVTTEKTLLTGDTTIVEYTTIKCDTVMAPDTLILADNKLDTVLSRDVSDIVCDTTVTYDTTINSLISTVIENATNIFPNPAKDELNIQSTFRISEVELINPQGQIIESKQINDYKTTINVKNYPRGTYILNIKTKSGAFQKKVLIQ